MHDDVLVGAHLKDLQGEKKVTIISEEMLDQLMLFPCIACT